MIILKNNRIRTTPRLRQWCTWFSCIKLPHIRNSRRWWRMRRQPDQPPIPRSSLITLKKRSSTGRIASHRTHHPNSVSISLLFITTRKHHIPHLYQRLDIHLPYKTEKKRNRQNPEQATHNMTTLDMTLFMKQNKGKLFDILNLLNQLTRQNNMPTKHRKRVCLLCIVQTKRRNTDACARLGQPLIKRAFERVSKKRLCPRHTRPRPTKPSTFLLDRDMRRNQFSNKSRTKKHPTDTQCHFHRTSPSTLPPRWGLWNIDVVSKRFGDNILDHQKKTIMK